VAEAQNGVLGAEIIGGIAVWLPADSQGSSIAHFGMFEVTNNPEVAETLIEAAESWLVEQFPIEAIRGPFSLDGRQPPGLLTDGFDVRSAPGLPYNPPYYPEIIEGAGYAPFQTARTYLVPARASSAPPQVHLIGETRTGFCITWDEDGQTLEAMIVSPDALGPSSRLPEQLLHLRMLRRSGRRLLARPAGDSVGPEWDDRRLALWRAVAGVAERLGYDEVLLGPIPDDEKMIPDARVTLGARPAHTYQVFEKAF
jgi:hypothetical protein